MTLEYKQVWRFYAEAIRESSKLPASLELPSDEAHFAYSVLRLAEGETVELADGCGWLAQARLTQSTKKAVVAEVESFRFVPPPEHKTIALVGLTKPGAIDEIIQACVEAGLSDLIFYKGDRSTSRQEFKTDKLERQIRELSRITKSPWLLNLKYQESLSAAFECARGICKLNNIFVCDERPSHDSESDHRARHLLQECGGALTGSIAFAVGPESSFSQKEYEFFLSEEHKSSACFVTLGPRILRTPAAVSAAAYMLSGLRDSGLGQTEFRVQTMMIRNEF